MKENLKKVHEHYHKYYFSDEIASRIKNNVQQNLNDPDLQVPNLKKQHSIAKKFIYTTAACLVLFGLFIGSAFVSPQMAVVASKIPFLSKIFEQEPLHDVLMETLKEKGYKISGAGYVTQGKIYFVRVSGTEEYYNQVKEEIKNLTENLISSRGYDSFKVEVDMERMEDESDLEKDPKYQKGEQLMGVLKEVVPKLQKQGYKIQSYGVGYPNPDTDEITLDFVIEDTEKRTDEIEATILEGTKEKGINVDFTIEFEPFNVQERAIESKWTTDILPVIWEGMLSKKEYKTKGVGYSFKKGTMNIFITTTIDKSDREASELAIKIKTSIQEFLQSDDLRDIVGDTPYKVVVRDKDSKEIN
ncbi:DUF4030 domain-containing protein [Ornithinibacillus scapharcae]|uniref:DUF4030 domain-containing protein n=1 Tax=Ornithinibacillus scapharcae TaxID=1147159 RepID=UPI000225AFFF|nr:DUF4030 domain-containing protein [Ornithinibacillus scapharcae]